MKQIKKKEFIQNLLFYSLLILIFGASLLIYLSQQKDENDVGTYRWLNVLTNSMASDKKDSFRQGDLIIIKKTADKDIKKGDIITFKMSDHNLLSHRVIDIRQNESGKTIFQTQGDMNQSPDPIVSSDRVVGKYMMKLPKLGKIMTLIKYKWYVFIGVVILFYFVKRVIESNIMKGESKKRGKKGKQKKFSSKRKKTNQSRQPSWETTKKKKTRRNKK